MNTLLTLLIAITVHFEFTPSVGGAQGYEMCSAATPAHANPVCTDIFAETEADLEVNIASPSYWRAKAYNKYGGNKAYSAWSNEIRVGAPASPGELVAPPN